MKASFAIVGKFPTLNDLIRAAQRSPYAYGRIKKEWEQRVANAAKLLPAFRSAKIRYVIYEGNRRRDKSNVAAVAIKFIEDALVRMCVLPGDGWEHVLEYGVEWSVDKDGLPRVVVRLEGEVKNERREVIRKRKLTAEARAKAVRGKALARAGANRASKLSKSTGKAKSTRKSKRR